MSQRQVVLDTETTGLKVEDGNRIIEIGCLEMIDRKLTGKHFHYYINPEREIEAGATAVHGISLADLSDKPRFHEIFKDLLDFIQNAELIIHNAPFDIAFLNYEMSLLKQNLKVITEYCSVVDTLQIAKKLHVGQRNNLDALCKRYKVDNSKRDLHGALLDAHLLAKVYLAMTGGQGSFFENLGNPLTHKSTDFEGQEGIVEKFNPKVQYAADKELKAHDEYLAMMQKKGKCRWLNN